MTTQQKIWCAEDISALTREAGELSQGICVNVVSSLLKKGHIKRFSKGETILERHTDVAKFFIALEGIVRLVALTEHGREFVSSFMGPGWIWGVHACLDETPESYDSRAETDCTVLVLDSKSLRDLMWQERELQEVMTKILCKRLKLALYVLEQFATWTPKQRLAGRLIQMLKGTVGASTDITRQSIAISQDAIASMIGLSRQRTNMLLKEFERDGLLQIDYGSIRIMDPVRLENVLNTTGV